MQVPETVLAIDWSGALEPAAQRRGIQLAECGLDGEARVSGGRLRGDVEELLLAIARAPEGADRADGPDGADRPRPANRLSRANRLGRVDGPDRVDRLDSGNRLDSVEIPSRAVVAGLDFSFSYPAWFLEEMGCTSAPELWKRVAVDGERWLREPHPYFWGKAFARGAGGVAGGAGGELAVAGTAGVAGGLPGIAAGIAGKVLGSSGRVSDGRRPAGHGAPELRGYRACELAAAQGNRLPLSSFQIGGAGAVGTGTLRGMPMLARLRAAGWSVWPFDPPRLPLLVEIYPRLLTGPVVKSSQEARALYLGQARFDGLDPQARESATASEDAFDALVSVLAMHAHRAEFTRLVQAASAEVRLEGAIWRPGVI